jgi:outer membrane protein OmpA-like peptidoglycan-associated protein/type II secretory pathway predicted ATPase ExeA
MYLDYYNIAENPFDTDKGKTSLWLGGNLSKVASNLKEAIMERKGIVFLTGDSGTGKSTLIKMITDILQEQFVIATLSNPELSGLDFFNVLSVRFKFNKNFNSKSAFLVHLRNYLRNSQPIDKNILLIINDADRLTVELFEELALMSEIELNDRKMISILLAGRKGWVDESMQKNIKRVSDKIAVVCNLDPLNEADTAQYIKYCLSTAGTKKNIFSTKAIHEIFSFSRGNLSLINSICDLALIKGYSSRKKTINTAIIKECGSELQEKGIIDWNVKLPPKFVVKKEKNNKITADQPSSSKRWLWIKTLFVLLFIFSSYVLYKSQTQDSNIWRTDEIAQDNYDFHKLKKENVISPDTSQEANQTYSNSESEKQETATVSPNVENESLEPYTAGERNSSARLTNTGREWPFATYKKIIYFEYDSNTLSPESLEILDEIAEFAIHNPKNEFIIKGYTDSIGAYSYNLTISKFRANSVKSYLIAKGVDPTKLETFGLGSQNPIFSNRTAGGRKLNRRVEIELKLDV